MLLSGTLHTPAIEARDSCQASALPPEPHLSMCDTILSLLSRHKHEKTQIRKKKYFLQRLAVGKDGFASGKTGTTEAEALEYDGKMMEKVPLESENSWTAFMSQLEPSSPCLSGPLTSS